MTKTATWGVMPAEVADQLRRREWENTAHRRARISGERSSAIRVRLRPPTGPQATANLNQLREYVDAWRRVDITDVEVRWADLRMRGFEPQRVPVEIEFGTFGALAEFIGGRAPAELRRWQDLVDRIEKARPGLRSAAIAALPRLDELDDAEFHELLQVLSQLAPGVGRGRYLRSLPLRGVGTKFIETQQTLVAALLDPTEDVRAAGGLLAWLDAVPRPTGTLLVRALSPEMRDAMLGIDAMWLAASDLVRLRTPARRLIVVENVESGFAVPDVDDAICVAGAGAELHWLSSPWAASRRIAYWGDLDSWGLYLLAQARRIAPTITSIMMDAGTLDAQSAFSEEPTWCPHAFDDWLNPGEKAALEKLRAMPASQRRLEQEKIDSKMIARAIEAWVNS